MNLGEKIETIILSRRSGSFGEYLGSSSDTFGACRIDGVVYKVARSVEVDEPTFVVHNVNDGTFAVAQDKHDLGCIKPTDFM